MAEREAQEEVDGGNEREAQEEWILEGVDDLDEKGHCHKNAIYAVLKHFLSLVTILLSF
jgi:hypothetical protein